VPAGVAVGWLSRARAATTSVWTQLVRVGCLTGCARVVRRRGSGSERAQRRARGDRGVADPRRALASVQMHRASIRNSLSMVDPAIGYIEDD
jgi:hypothetical protein